MVSSAPDWVRGDPASLRQWRNAQPEVTRPILPADVTLGLVPETAGGGIECRPTDAEAGIVLHFHGGGFVVGSPHTHRCVGAWLAHVLRRVVWLAPYPLAPETTLPRQPVHAAAVLKQAVERSGGPVILSGDSAGALMALWAFSGSDQNVRASVDGALLLYGWFGSLPADGPEVDGLGPESVAAMRDRLDPKGLIESKPMLDPIHPDFPIPDRTIAISAEHDPLIDDTRSLVSAHSRIVGMETPGLGHGFLSVPSQSEEALNMLRTAADLLSV